MPRPPDLSADSRSSSRRCCSPPRSWSARTASGALALALALACGGLLPFASCRTRPTPDELELEAIARAHAHDHRQMQEAKAEVQRTKHVPQVHEFPGHGTILVHDWHFEGLPRQERVRVRYRYENTTGRTLDHVRLRLTVRDGRGRTVEAVEQRLAIPFGRWFMPHSTWTDEIQALTLGVHRDADGWDWVISCQAEPPPPEAAANAPAGPPPEAAQDAPAGAATDAPAAAPDQTHPETPRPETPARTRFDSRHR